MIQNSPKVSIIVPIYNVEKYLDRCMAFLLNQTLKDIEIIMVDDGSPDNCPNMCDEYARKDSRVKVIHKKNGGLGYARNSGLEVATGEYVVFVDSDDYVDVTMYETLYNEAEKTKADAVFCCFKTENAKGAWTDNKEVASEQCWQDEDVQDFMLDMIASAPQIGIERKYQMSVWHGIYRRSVIEKNGIRYLSEREYASEDLPFQVDFLLKSRKVVFLPDVLYAYCLNDTSLTKTFKEEKYAAFRKLYLLLEERLSDSDIPADKYQQRINRFFIGYTRNFMEIAVANKYSRWREIFSHIANDKIWTQIFHDYPSCYLPLYARIQYILLRKKYVGLMKIYYQVLQTVRSVNWHRM